MIQVPYWDGNPAHPFPSVTVRIDFRGPDVGDFVFHCHILGHEDLGMMNIIRVQSPYVASNAKPDAPAKPAALDSPALEVAGQEVAPNPTGHRHGGER
jgi:hypothetical protein